MSTDLKIYCGAKKTPKNSRIGTQEECMTKGQIRRYGIEQINLLITKNKELKEKIKEQKKEIQISITEGKIRATNQAIKDTEKALAKIENEKDKKIITQEISVAKVRKEKLEKKLDKKKKKLDIGEEKEGEIKDTKQESKQEEPVQKEVKVVTLMPEFIRETLKNAEERYKSSQKEYNDRDTYETYIKKFPDPDKKESILRKKYEDDIKKIQIYDFEIEELTKKINELVDQFREKYKTSNIDAKTVTKKELNDYEELKKQREKAVANKRKTSHRISTFMDEKKLKYSPVEEVKDINLELSKMKSEKEKKAIDQEIKTKKKRQDYDDKITYETYKKDNPNPNKKEKKLREQYEDDIEKEEEYRDAYRDIYGKLIRLEGRFMDKYGIESDTFGARRDVYKRLNKKELEETRELDKQIEEIKRNLTKYKTRITRFINSRNIKKYD